MKLSDLTTEELRRLLRAAERNTGPDSVEATILRRELIKRCQPPPESTTKVDSMMASERLNYALIYARRGWPVFPRHSIADGRCTCGKSNCSSPGKHPRTRNGFKDATTDKATIENWWSQWPDANIGICTRTDTAFSLAGHLAAFCIEETGQHLTEAQIIQLMRTWNMRCRPPLGDTELVKAVESAMKNGTPREPHLVPLNTKAKRRQKPRDTETAPGTGDDASGAVQPADDRDEELPEVVLPEGEYRITDTARMLAELLGATGEYYNRGGTLVRVTCDKNDLPILKAVKAAEMPGAFESVAAIKKPRRVRGEWVPQPGTCNEATAKLIIHAPSFIDTLPLITLVSPSPVLIERNGKLVQVIGYDEQSGILAGGQAVPDVQLCEAVKLLTDVLKDYQFASKHDRSRMLAALITPGLIQGGLLGGRAPWFLSKLMRVRQRDTASRALPRRMAKGYRPSRNAKAVALVGWKKRSTALSSLARTLSASTMFAANLIHRRLSRF